VTLVVDHLKTEVDSTSKNAEECAGVMKEYKYIINSFISSLVIGLLLHSAFLLTDINTFLTLSAVPILLTGCMITWINQIVLVGYAFERSFLAGLACLFVPLAIFACLDAEQWKTATVPLVKTFIGFGISMIGIGLIVLTNNFG
jgi:hypothetical protein